jgi:hypothetical protein
MKEKILTLLTFIFIAISISGFTYAQWNDTITVSNTMTFGYWGDLNIGATSTEKAIYTKHFRNLPSSLLTR